MNFLLLIVLLNGEIQNIYLPNKAMCMKIKSENIYADKQRRIQLAECLPIELKK
jgi:hypothetical protein